CGRAHTRLGGDIAVATWPVLHDELLAEPLREPLSHQACGDVTCAAGGKADNDAHRPRRIGLRPSKARKDRECGSTCRQTQKLSGGKFHSITSSARASSVGGTSRPSALAVLRLMINSTLVACWTGRSAGFSPLRTRPT